MANVVPANVIAAVEGDWNLGEHYRISLARAGTGLRVNQDAEIPRKRRIVRENQVEYDQSSGTLRFDGVGSIHRTVVTLRPSNGELEYAFSSEIAPGKWTQGGWQKATRSKGPR